MQMILKVSHISTLCLLIVCVNSQLSLDEIINNVFTTHRTPVATPSIAVPANKFENPNRSGGGGGGGSSNGGSTVGGKYRSCGLDKECVPRHLCVDGAISTTGQNFIDIRINDETCAYNELCCSLPNKRDKPVIAPVPPEVHQGCGWRNVDGVGYKIVGKVDESEFGEFPWMVAILRVEDDGAEGIHLYECGGSLIAPNVVLTAAHCVVNRQPVQLLVRAGEWDTQNTNEILPHVDKPVREIITHEHYNKGTLYNDIALLILEESFEWMENIRPICLPEPNTNFDGAHCIATGWGRDKFGRDGKYQVILKKVDLPIVPHHICEENLRTTRLGYYYNLDVSFLCAGGEKDKDTCKGDGGSPLVCPIPGAKNRYYQAGIVSWGVGCAVENLPGVYANVPYLRDWLTKKLIARDINFAHFTPNN